MAVFSSVENTHHLNNNNNAITPIKAYIMLLVLLITKFQHFNLYML